MCTLNHLSLSPCKASEIERMKNKIATRAQTRTTTTTNKQKKNKKFIREPKEYKKTRSIEKIKRDESNVSKIY